MIECYRHLVEKNQRKPHLTSGQHAISGISTGNSFPFNSWDIFNLSATRNKKKAIQHFRTVNWHYQIFYDSTQWCFLKLIFLVLSQFTFIWRFFLTINFYNHERYVRVNWAIRLKILPIKSNCFSIFIATHAFSLVASKQKNPTPWRQLAHTGKRPRCAIKSYHTYKWQPGKQGISVS